jgi:hypothetical protein
VGRVGNTGVNRADFRALGGIVVAYTLDTFIEVDDIDSFTLADGVDWALWLAGSAADTFLRNFVRHSIYLLNLNEFLVKVPYKNI